MKKDRIQKVMSEQGYCSRRAAEKLIADGRVKVNGHAVSLGDKMSASDVLTVDGERLRVEKSPEKLYFALYKPRGFVTTLSDEKDRKCVSDLMEEVGTRLFPIGRLDLDSEGLLIMTNDGDLANAVLASKKNITKLYRVTTRPNASEEQLIALSSGVTLDDGYTTKPITIRTITAEPNRSVLEFSLHEGRNRQIRRMCDAVGLEVIRLRRTAIGPVKLGMLGQGKYRELTKQEVAALKNAVGR